MLTLATLGPGAVSYLEETVARGVEDSYPGVKETPGQWLGTSAARLGLDCEVDGESFHRLLSHADPSTGARLTEGRSDPKVVGIDATFCAPKSVSLLQALGSGDVSNEVRDAHDAAVHAAVEFFEHAAQGHCISTRPSGTADRTCAPTNDNRHDDIPLTGVPTTGKAFPSGAVEDEEATRIHQSVGWSRASNELNTRPGDVVGCCSRERVWRDGAV